MPGAEGIVGIGRPTRARVVEQEKRMPMAVSSSKVQPVAIKVMGTIMTIKYKVLDLAL